MKCIVCSQTGLTRGKRLHYNFQDDSASQNKVSFSVLNVQVFFVHFIIILTNNNNHLCKVNTWYVLI